jgi:hypothetical protein
MCHSLVGRLGRLGPGVDQEYACNINGVPDVPLGPLLGAKSRGTEFSVAGRTTLLSLLFFTFKEEQRGTDKKRLRRSGFCCSPCCHKPDQSDTCDLAYGWVRAPEAQNFRFINCISLINPNHQQSIAQPPSDGL